MSAAIPVIRLPQSHYFQYFVQCILLFSSIERIFDLHNEDLEISVYAAAVFGLSLKEIDAAIEKDLNNDPSENNIADSIAEALTSDHWPSVSDANIIYYVSGAIARSVVRTNKCDHCQEALIRLD